MRQKFFYDFDTILDKYYKRPESGTVNRTHVFRMFHGKPCILKLQNSASSEVSTQNLRKGPWLDKERVRLLLKELIYIQPKEPPELKPIKVLELEKKWRPLVPEEFRDDFCPVATEAVIGLARSVRSINTASQSERVRGESNQETYVTTEENKKPITNER